MKSSRGPQGLLLDFIVSIVTLAQSLVPDVILLFHHPIDGLDCKRAFDPSALIACWVNSAVPVQSIRLSAATKMGLYFLDGLINN